MVGTNFGNILSAAEQTVKSEPQARSHCRFASQRQHAKVGRAEIGWHQPGPDVVEQVCGRIDGGSWQLNASGAVAQQGVMGNLSKFGHMEMSVNVRSRT